MNHIQQFGDRSFQAVGLWYERFPQLTDEEACELQQKADESPGAAMNTDACFCVLPVA
jgi:predicted phosphoribosyltransferase